jgi:hypothetical protein
MLQEKKTRRKCGNDIGLRLIVDWLKAKSKIIVELPLMNNGLEAWMGAIQASLKARSSHTHNY